MINTLQKMSIIPEEERFAKNAVIMASAVYSCAQKMVSEGYTSVDLSTIEFIIKMMSVMDKNALIKGFITNSHKECWNKIKDRKESFFIENAGDIFKYLPNDKVNLFKDLFMLKNNKGEEVISQDIKTQFWDLLSAMVKISIKYIHKHRQPYSYPSQDGGIITSYRNSFMNEVDLKQHADNWKVTLDFPLSY